MVHIIHVIGARPNYMKIAPIYSALSRFSTVRQTLVHTGQHYSPEMSAQFFDDLGMPKPDINLEVGSGTHAEQTAKIMQSFEPILIDLQPDMVLVVGDVNSTIACALTAKKLHIKVAHVEAGLRSNDMLMPEEINRVLTDRISDYLFTTEASGNTNLKAEGVPDEQVFFVGNVMIDSLVEHLEKAKKSDILTKMGQQDGEYLLVTIHRPSNVDSEEDLTRTVETLTQAAQRRPVLAPLHPRSLGRLESTGLMQTLADNPNITTTGPLGYLDFLRCQMGARAILTDSGGIQEESTYLGVPCLTMRENTERPVTISDGSNQLIGIETADIIAALDDVLTKPSRSDRKPPLWDGKAAERIAEILVNLK